MSETNPGVCAAKATGGESPIATHDSSNDVDESIPEDGRPAAWAAGFVTSEGAHIPLFIPCTPEEERDT